MPRKIFYTILIYLVGMGVANAQKSLIDSIRREMRMAPNDSIRLLRTMDLVRVYAEVNPDTSYFYAEKAVHLSQYLGLKIDEGHALAEKGYALLNSGNYPRSLQTFIAALAIAEDKSSERKVLMGDYKTLDEFYDRKESPYKQRLELIARIRQYMGILYLNANNFQKSLDNYKIARDLVDETGNKYLQSIIYSTIGRVYLSLKMPDSAMIAEQHAYEIGLEIGLKKYMGSILLNLARIHAFQGNDSLAQVYFRKARETSAEQSYYRGVVSSSLFIADYFKRMGNADSSLYNIEHALDVARGLNSPDLLLRGYTALADHYKLHGNSDSAVRYQSMIIKINDSLFSSKQAQQFQNIDFDEAQRKQQIEAAKTSYKEKVRRNLLLAGLGVFLLLAIILLRNSLQRRKANRLLSQQKAGLESALDSLQKTQKQLVQSEKMASLGELTAGIAHEIQNPLNFVNNFSELNTELIEDLKSELSTVGSSTLRQAQGDASSGTIQAVIEIANSIDENEKKINFHGKRADSIVKSMLQHSRAGTGQKELTDINKLVDEFVRLAYHGIRAKDSSFNATLETNLDPAVGKINVVSQDIGRVLLNLINNALHAVAERKKASTLRQVQGSASSATGGYEPTVSLTSKRIQDIVQVEVKDNGGGIPQKIREKIFQPFFTTKSAGEGTGLGLSLSYDIIHAHGGEIKLESTEGEGTTFIIRLPG